MNVRKIPQKSLVSGVLAGFAYQFKVKTWLVRLVFIIALFMSFGIFILAYILLAMLMPSWETIPKDYSEVSE